VAPRLTQFVPAISYIGNRPDEPRRGPDGRRTNVLTRRRPQVSATLSGRESLDGVRPTRRGTRLSGSRSENRSADPKCRPAFREFVARALGSDWHPAPLSHIQRGGFYYFIGVSYQGGCCKTAPQTFRQGHHIIKVPKMAATFQHVFLEKWPSKFVKWLLSRFSRRKIFFSSHIFFPKR